jgi:hypothetical protein
VGVERPGPVTASWKHINDPSGSIEYGQFLNQLRNYQNVNQQTHLIKYNSRQVSNSYMFGHQDAILRMSKTPWGWNWLLHILNVKICGKSNLNITKELSASERVYCGVSWLSVSFQCAISNNGDVFYYTRLLLVFSNNPFHNSTYFIDCHVIVLMTHAYLFKQ